MMYRITVKNKSTGELILVWSYTNDGTGENGLYKDVALQNKLDKNQYEAVEKENEKTYIPTPFELFGVECEKGWYPLLSPIVDYIDNYNKNKKEIDKIDFTQIKEKWGYLNVYVSHGTQELFDLIHKAEEESGEICEFCGTKENIGMTQGYNMTICHDCIKEMSAKRNFGSYQWRRFDDGKIYWIHPDGTEEIIKKEEEMP